MVQNGTYLIHYGVKGMKWGEHRMAQEYVPVSRAELVRRGLRSNVIVSRPGSASAPTAGGRPRPRVVKVTSGGTGVQKRTPINTGGKPVGAASVTNRAPVIVKKKTTSGGGTATATKKSDKAYDTKEAKEARRQAAIDRVNGNSGTATEKKTGSGKKGSSAKKGSSTKKESEAKGKSTTSSAKKSSGSSGRSSTSSSKTSTKKANTSSKKQEEQKQEDQQNNVLDQNPFEALKNNLLDHNPFDTKNTRDTNPFEQQLQEIKINDDNIDVFANKVINGEYGNGAQRREALGANYHKIQTRVNEILREVSKKKQTARQTPADKQPVQKKQTKANNAVSSMKAERKARRRREEIA